MANTNDYLEARQKFFDLRQEYERKLAELEPLRQKITEAKIAADAAWKAIMCQTT